MKDLRIGRRGKSYVIQDYANNRKQVGAKFKYFNDVKVAYKKLSKLSYLNNDLDLNMISKDMQIKYLKRRIRELMLSKNS